MVVGSTLYLEVSWEVSVEVKDIWDLKDAYRLGG